ncbi:MAG: carbon-nitrogen hydrolase family protein [Pedosphaera sp.]|nr:carbon-nitrogen hydrolase family protein [Pedosphaera sp.]
MPKLALIQMRVVGGAKRENLRHARDLIQQAASAGAQIVVLPEAMTLGWTHPSARTDADALPDGESIVALREAARETGVYICSGFIERAGDMIFNSAVLIAPDGSIMLHHRKLNELELAHDLYALGDRLQVAETPFGRIGLMICADGFARGQVIARALGYMGAQIILSPSAWAVPSDHDNVKEPYGQLWLDNYSSVARDHRLWIIGVSNVGWITAGPWSGRKCIGCSLAVGPSGEKVMQGPYGVDMERILTIDVKTLPRPAQGDGWARFWQD